MKILILGAYGMLGHKIFQVLSGKFNVYATCRTYREEWNRILPEDRLFPGVQAEIFDSVVNVFAEVKPDVVINCIGIVKQLDAAKDPIPSITINALLPHKLALLCQRTGVRFIHLSTDCVFSGEKGNYSEKDFSDARDIYGRTKYLGEVDGEGCFTIRSSIIGKELGSCNGLLEWLVSQRESKGFFQSHIYRFYNNGNV